MQATSPPDLTTVDGWSTVLYALAEPFLTPWMLAAILCAWALTHWGKLTIAVLRPGVADDETRWKAAVAGISLVAGLVAGAAVFYPLGDTIAIAIVALLNGFLWRFAVAFAPKRVRRLLQTHIDRRFIPPDQDG